MNLVLLKKPVAGFAAGAQIHATPAELAAAGLKPVDYELHGTYTEPAPASDLPMAAAPVSPVPATPAATPKPMPTKG